MTKFQNVVTAAKWGAKDLRTKAAATGTGLSVVAGSAMATGTGGFDIAPVLAIIADNVVLALALIGAYILARWTLRTMGLLKPQ